MFSTLFLLVLMFHLFCILEYSFLFFFARMKVNHKENKVMRILFLPVSAIQYHLPSFTVSPCGPQPPEPFLLTQLPLSVSPQPHFPLIFSYLPLLLVQEEIDKAGQGHWTTGYQEAPANCSDTASVTLGLSPPGSWKDGGGGRGLCTLSEAPGQNLLLCARGEKQLPGVWAIGTSTVGHV